MLGHVIDERVHQDVDLGGPPAVDGLLGDPGPGGDPLDGHAGEPALDEEVVDRLEYGLTGSLAPAVPVSVMPSPGDDDAAVGTFTHAGQPSEG
ncbi:hypothetical protein GCM10027176_05440 [Actinoallomurus bryophytorum]